MIYIKHYIFKTRNRQEVHDILKGMDIKTYEANTFLQINNAEKGILFFRHG